MLVILRENVENLGRIGDVVKVTEGYARNFLLPRQLGVAADAGNMKKIEHHKKSLEKKRLAQKEAAEALAKKVNDLTVTIQRKVGEGDKLFGSVNATDVLDGLKKAGFDLEKRVIQLTQPIKTLGVHPVVIKFESDVTANIKVSVVKE
jgi:large subunit ribosomal protein L9